MNWCGGPWRDAVPLAPNDWPLALTDFLATCLRALPLFIAETNLFQGRVAADGTGPNRRSQPL